MKKKINLEVVKEFIEVQGPETKIYIGCDSERYRKNNIWYADYVLAIVIHKDGKHGCKIFGEIITEKDYDQKANRPTFRLMTEVYKVSELYLRLAEVLDGRKVEVHLDINSDDDYISNVVLSQAVGFIKGTCNVVPMVKPNAFAASYAANRLKELHVA